MLFRWQRIELFPVQFCLVSLGQYTGFLALKCCPKSIKTTSVRIFLCNVAWSSATYTRLCGTFYLCNVLRQHLRGFFPVQCCLRLLGEHGVRFYLCNVAPRVLRQQWTGFFFLCNVVWILLDNITQNFYLCNVPRVLKQHWTGFFPVQCCPKSIKTTLSRIFTCAVLSQEY